MKKELTVSYEHLDHWSMLSESDQQLVEAAQKVCESAYAPYSKFQVGASLRLEDGNVLTGSNQENIAYPSGLCAERVTLFYAGANFPDKAVETLCIVAKGDLVSQDALLSPCGACRQVMVETEARQDQSYRVILVSQNGACVIFDSAKSLLPLAFGL